MARDNDQGTLPEQQPSGVLSDPYTRRKFLRAAVVGTAGVAGAAGVAGVALARSGQAPSVLSPVLTSQQTEKPGFFAGFEDTKLTGTCITKYNTGGPGTSNDYFIFYGKDLPGGSGAAGDYSYTVTQQINSGTQNPISGGGAGTASAPWEYKGANPVHVDIVAANTGTNCPSGGSAVGTAHSSLPVTFHLGSTSDVIIYLHIEYDEKKLGAPPMGQTTTFRGILTGPVSFTVMETVTAS